MHELREDLCNDCLYELVILRLQAVVIMIQILGARI